MRKITLLSLICVVSAVNSWAQTLPSPEDPVWRYQQWMVTAGLAQDPQLVFTTIDDRALHDEGPWKLPDPKKQVFTMGTTEVGVVDNTGYASTFNTGGIWHGRGVTGWTKTSASFAWGYLSARLGVQAWASQNLAFDLRPSGLADQPLATPDGQYIDTPQRFGYDPFAVWGLQNSEVRLNWGPMELSVSNQNAVFGPSVFNPLLLSSNAEGIPHVRLGLNTIPTPAGKVEAQLMYGKLSTSAYWDPNAGPSDRFFGGLFIGYQPSFFPELTLGAGRTIISNWNDASPQVATALFLFDPGDSSGTLGKGVSHQHVSLTYDLKFPSIGFETYGEWGKNDYSPLSMYWINPNHMQAYTLGMKKTFTLPQNGLLGVGVEETILSQSPESLINYNGYSLAGDFYSGWSPSFGAGYTNNGMVVGASIGNGSEAQYLYADLYYPQWHFGLQLRRWANDVSALYLGTLPAQGANNRENTNDVEMSAAFRTDYRWNDWLFSGELIWAEDYNRNQWPKNNVLNVTSQVAVQYLW